MKYEVWFVRRGKKGKVRNIEIVKIERFQDKLRSITRSVGLVDRITGKVADKVVEKFEEYMLERLKANKNRKKYKRRR